MTRTVRVRTPAERERERQEEQHNEEGAQTPEVLLGVHFIPFRASQTIKTITALCVGGVKDTNKECATFVSLPES